MTALEPARPTVPALEGHVDRLGLLKAMWLATYDSAHTRRAYGRDLDHWLAFCARPDVDVHPLAARRVHVDAWKQTGAGFTVTPAKRSLARRLAAVSSWYAYLVEEDLADRNPAAHVKRPKVDRDESPTRGLDADEAKVFLLAAKTSGEFALRELLAFQLMLLNGIRVEGTVNLDVTDLGRQGSYRTITYTAKGGAEKTVPLPVETQDTLDAYLAGRTEGPLLVTRTGGRVDTSALFRATQRCAAVAGIVDPDEITPHSLRHTFVTLALEDGVPLQVVQDAVGHGDPRQTQSYNTRRNRLEQHPGNRLSAKLNY